jgi:hypothetical protein
VGNDLGDIALNRLADLLGAEVIATGPPESPLPVTGPCTRCGSPTTRYGPAGSPLCDQRETAELRDLPDRPANVSGTGHPGSSPTRNLPAMSLILATWITAARNRGHGLSFGDIHCCYLLLPLIE